MEVGADVLLASETAATDAVQLLQAVERTDQQVVTQRSVRTFHCRDYAVSCPEQIGLLSEVWYGGCLASVTRLEASEVTLQFDVDDEVVLALQEPLLRRRLDADPAAVDAALVDYWFPAWNRDTRTDEEDITHWPGFLSLLHRDPPPVPPFELHMSCP